MAVGYGHMRGRVFSMGPGRRATCDVSREVAHNQTITGCTYSFEGVKRRSYKRLCVLTTSGYRF